MTLRRLFRAGFPIFSAIAGYLSLNHFVAAAPTPKTVSITAYTSDGKLLSTQDLLRYISPKNPQEDSAGEAHGLFVMDMDGNPQAGRPWWDSSSEHPSIRWIGNPRIKLSLPWPVAQDGFSTVFIDKENSGFSDGDTILLNEEIASTQYRLFTESFKDRRAVWNPTYKPSDEMVRLQKGAMSAMAKAHGGKTPQERAILYEQALTQISLAWAKMLFEHGAQMAADRRINPSLRWGLTLDETYIDRLTDEKRILRDLSDSGANWVRIVFRANPEDFLYERPRSFNEYDTLISDLIGMKIRVMGSVLDSTFWPADMPPNLLPRRTRNLVVHFKDKIRSWEVASEVNGNWLGGHKHPLSDEVILKAFPAAAAEVKDVDPALETVAALYWWEGTAGDDAHPLFTWLDRTIPKEAFKNIDVIGLSVFPDDNPMGMAFDTVFQRLGRLFPDKRLMLGAYGYVEENELQGYWWLDPNEVDNARKDLVILYTGAACAIPHTLGGGFWWSALTQMLSEDRHSRDLSKIYRREIQRLRH